MPTYTKIKKHLNYLFINTTPLNETPTWARVMKSTEWTDTMNATTTTYDYIADASPTDVVEQYSPEISVALTAYVGEPVYNYVYELYKNQSTGSEINTQALRVFQHTTAGVHDAQLSNVTVIIDSYNFASGIITFKVKQSGNITLGTATISSTDDDSGNTIYTPVFTSATPA